MSDPSATAAVGVVLVGHGRTASELLGAARGIVGTDAPSGLDGVVAVDAGEGGTPRLDAELCAVIEGADAGTGVLVMVDLWGASPCSCAQAQAGEHRIVTLAGLNLAMLLKLAALDRAALGPERLAQACGDSGRRAVQITSNESSVVEPSVKEASA